MTYTFTDKKMESKDDLRNYAKKKIDKFDRLFRQASDAGVVFSRERGRYTAEITLKNSGMIFRASSTTSDMFASIDDAVTSIERQIRRNKGKLSKKLKSGPIDWPESNVMVEPEEDEETFEIIRTKRFPMKPMTAEEAILQMNLLEHAFYAFKNVDEGGSFSVVYRRDNGGYGIMSDAGDED